MFKVKILISVAVFSSLLVITSIIKNQTREVEKKIFSIYNIILSKEKDLKESQLDFSYLISPSIIEKKIENFNIQTYVPMEYSKIFLSFSNFVETHKKYVIQENNEKKIQKR